jgi:hypothetical protein
MLTVASIVSKFESRVGSAAARTSGAFGFRARKLGKPRNEPSAARPLRARCFYRKSAIEARLYWRTVAPESIMTG